MHANIISLLNLNTIYRLSKIAYVILSLESVKTKCLVKAYIHVQPPPLPLINGPGAVITEFCVFNFNYS